MGEAQSIFDGRMKRQRDFTRYRRMQLRMQAAGVDMPGNGSQPSRPTTVTGATRDRWIGLHGAEGYARYTPRILPTPAYALAQLVWIAGQRAMITDRQRAGTGGQYVYQTDAFPHGYVSETALKPVEQELPLDREENWIPPHWKADAEMELEAIA